MFTSLILFAAWKIIVFLFLAVIYLVLPVIAIGIIVCIATGFEDSDNFEIINPKSTLFFGIPVTILALAGLSLIWNISGGARKELLESYSEFVAEDTPNVELSYGTEIQRFTLVSITPPKQVYITLKGPDGKVYENLYVSKHCAVMPEVGTEYNIPMIKYSFSKAPLDVMVRWPNLYHIFCQE